MLAVTTIWEPLTVAAMVIIAVGGGVKWIIDRTDRQFERVHDRIDALTARLPGNESKREKELR